MPTLLFLLTPVIKIHQDITTAPFYQSLWMTSLVWMQKMKSVMHNPDNSRVAV
jgi:hypothetical protein